MGNNRIGMDLRAAFENEFHCERNAYGHYEKSFERLMWLACEFGAEWQQKQAVTIKFEDIGD